MLQKSESECANSVTVLGAGIVGICSAISLAEQGVKVQLIDRDAPGQGASHGNAGIISPWSVVPQSLPGTWKNVPGWLLDPLGPVAVKPSYLPRLIPWAMRFFWEGRASRVAEVADAMDLLNRDNVDLYRQYLKGTNHENLVQDCYYVHAFRTASKADLAGIDYSMRKEKGADMERIDGPELRRIEPALSSDFTAAILIKGQARALSPGKIGTVLADKFQRLGGEIIRADIHELKPAAAGGWDIQTSSGTQWSERILVAMGAWSVRLLAPLLKEAGLKVPMEAERGYHILFKNPGVSLNHSVMDMDMKFVASSMTTGLRTAGTAEFAGLDAPANEKRIKGLMSLARGMIPDLNDAEPETWMGIRPSLPDSLPCIGAIPGFSGLYGAFGHSHYGFMMAPKTGRLIADLMQGKPNNINLDPYRVSRF
jgi:D-amino-acid dehydrogenase